MIRVRINGEWTTSHNGSGARAERKWSAMSAWLISMIKLFVRNLVSHFQVSYKVGCSLSACYGLKQHNKDNQKLMHSLKAFSRPSKTLVAQLVKRLNTTQLFSLFRRGNFKIVSKHGWSIEGGSSADDVLRNCVLGTDRRCLQTSDDSHTVSMWHESLLLLSAFPQFPQFVYFCL